MPPSARESRALLDPSDDDNSSCDDTDILEEKSRLRPERKKVACLALALLLVGNAMLFVASITILVASKDLTDQRTGKHIWEAANAYSPITSQMNIELTITKMKGPFLDEDHDIFRQPPSPEVDAAWHNLTEHGVAYVSSSDLIKMGKNPSVVARFGPEFGLGDDAYSVETDIIHKIHCLDMIRKDVYFDHYWLETYPDRIPSERHRWHTNHCLYILLQSLICDANTDLIPQVWMEDYPWPTPDFNINRKCGNLDAVKQWEHEHRVDGLLVQQMPKPHGQKVMAMSDELKRVFEVEVGWDAKNGVV